MSREYEVLLEALAAVTSDASTSEKVAILECGLDGLLGGGDDLRDRVSTLEARFIDMQAHLIETRDRMLQALADKSGATTPTCGGIESAGRTVTWPPTPGKTKTMTVSPADCGSTGGGTGHEEMFRMLYRLRDEQRFALFSEFCTHCGSLDPSCQCWNDE